MTRFYLACSNGNADTPGYTVAASPSGAVRCDVSVRKGKDWVTVRFGSWRGSATQSITLYDGPMCGPDDYSTGRKGNRK